MCISQWNGRLPILNFLLADEAYLVAVLWLLWTSLSKVFPQNTVISSRYKYIVLYASNTYDTCVLFYCQIKSHEDTWRKLTKQHARKQNHLTWHPKTQYSKNKYDRMTKRHQPQTMRSKGWTASQCHRSYTQNPLPPNSKLIFAGCLNCFAKPVPGWLVKIDAHSPWPLCPALKASLPAIAITLWQVLPKIRCIAVSYSKHFQASAFIALRKQPMIQKWLFSKPCGMIRPPFNYDKNSPTGRGDGSARHHFESLRIHWLWQ